MEAVEELIKKRLTEYQLEVQSYKDAMRDVEMKMLQAEAKAEVLLQILNEYTAKGGGNHNPLVDSSANLDENKGGLEKEETDSIDTELTFPHQDSRPEQILWLFHNVIKEAKKLPSIQNLYTWHSNKDRNIKYVFRGMVKRGELVGIKYNDANKFTYYGLPEWLNDSKDDFQQNYIPRQVKYMGIESKEWINSGSFSLRTNVDGKDLDEMFNLSKVY
jgi:hypothetical protein